MWIVRYALLRPYTFIVAAIMITLLGIFTILRTPVDIFPAIRIPIVAVVWGYGGLPPQEMADRVVAQSERVASTVVNDIEHVESTSLNGIAVVKYFFQPLVDQDLAVAQITSISQTLLRFLPQGMTPPFILSYNASTVPILQLGLSSKSLSEAQIFDSANNTIRTQLSTVAGAALPYPYGGKQRQIQVDLDPAALRARDLSAQDVANAIGLQNLIIPAGTQKIGDIEYFVKLNASPQSVDQLNDLPIRVKDGVVTYVRDVAHVHDGSAPQTNIVRVDGQRAILMSIIKTGTASTLDVVDKIRNMIPGIQNLLPPEIDIKLMGDQSLFVRSAVNGVIEEGIIAASLTALLILLFLGSWRSTLIITISIPLSALTSVTILSALGETINIMTLGGLALAVGILVDDATVAIENINLHLEQGKDVETAILDGAQQIALPALVSTLCICIVFVPMFFLTGIARYLFVPLAEAVIFAMLASYFLSRTLVPTLAKYWLQKHSAPDHTAENTSWLDRLHGAFNRGFHAMRQDYQLALNRVIGRRKLFLFAAIVVVGLSSLLVPWLGRDFFPSVDAGQIKLHLRARTGTRIEDTTKLCDDVEATLRQIIPADEIVTLVDNIGIPYSGINLSYSTSAPVGSGDADIMITLTPKHHPTADYIREIRQKLPTTFPDTLFVILPADIVTQILNFGLPAPLDIQISGYNIAANREYAAALLEKLRRIPGAIDMHIHQAFDYPQINVDVDRSNAAQLGLTQKDVATDLLISLSGSFSSAPAFWLDPKTGAQYSVTTQTPQYRMQSMQDLQNTPITGTDPKTDKQVLSNIATLHRSMTAAVVNHYNILPVIDIFGSVQDTDLGSVSDEASHIINESMKDLPKGSKIIMRGQVETMNASFHGLLLGIAGAILLVYLLIVINFQSWLDPLIIISALPAALAGIIWMLFMTHTTISVPALTGALMCIGVATANSILVVSFARERMQHGDDAITAAIQAGVTRIRPVLMTALAMIIGMIPMALGLGDGGEQNAPLGRAVIGGLLFSTVATLLVVPAVFALVHQRQPTAAEPASLS
jgi:CzcA family heavy metal efflux pump